MRLFFALWPPAQAAVKLDRIARSTARNLGGRPTRRETLHLTLAFLGEVEECDVSRLVVTAQGIGSAPFELEIDCLDRWHHNRLLWAGCRKPLPALLDLVSNMRVMLHQAGFIAGKREAPFTPHVTLIRKLPENAWANELPTIEPIHWPCKEFALVRSRLSEIGPAYESLAKFPLIGR